jgi:hypothetical protein
MKENRDNRLFIEIKDNNEKLDDALIIHYFNGYKKIKIKISNTTNNIVKMWFNGFIQDDYEILFENKEYKHCYKMEQDIIDPLKYRSRNIIERLPKIIDIDKEKLLKDLISEIDKINPSDLKLTVIKYLDKYINDGV